MKKILVALFALLSLNIFSANEDNVKKISVTGNAQREIMPDMATLSFQIKDKDKTLSAASSKVKQKLEKFKKDLRTKNLMSGDIETVSISDRKIKDKNYSGKKTVSSYSGQMSVFVKDVDFEKLGELIELNSGDKFQSVEKDDEENVYEIKLKESDKTLNGTLNKLFSKIDILKNKLRLINAAKNNIFFGDYEIKENSENYEETEVYEVTQNLKVVTKNLKNLNEIISLADSDGLNIAGSIKFDLSNRDEIESQMYGDAYNQAKQKAESILKSSDLKVGDVIVVSEDLDFQQKMIDRIDSQWEVKTDVESSLNNLESQLNRLEGMEENNYSDMKIKGGYDFYRGYKTSKVRVDYTPKPLKIEQNISVMYEMQKK
mgnify:FL=1